MSDEQFLSKRKKVCKQVVQSCGPKHWASVCGVQCVQSTINHIISGWRAPPHSSAFFAPVCRIVLHHMKKIETERE